MQLFEFVHLLLKMLLNIGMYKYNISVSEAPLNYINLKCTLNTKVMKKTLRKKMADKLIKYKKLI